MQLLGHTFKYHNPGLVPWAFIIISVAVLMTLGSWQLNRLVWKEALLDKMTVGQELVPLAALPQDADGLEQALYRRVKISANLDRSVYFKRAGVHRDHGKGYYILSLIALPGVNANADAEPSYMLVNRGFVAGETQAVLDALAGEREAAKNPTIIEGLLRPSYPPRLFSPGNHADKNIWFSEDVGAMARQAAAQYDAFDGAPQILPYVIEATAEQPARGEAITHPRTSHVRMRNDHLGYAVTWFGLALVSVVMFGCFCIRRERGAV